MKLEHKFATGIIITIFVLVITGIVLPYLYANTLHLCGSANTFISKSPRRISFHQSPRGGCQISYTLYFMHLSKVNRINICEIDCLMDRELFIDKLSKAYYVSYDKGMIYYYNKDVILLDSLRVSSNEANASE